MPRHYFLQVVASGVLILSLFQVASCGNAPSSCNFTYRQQVTGNVSTIVWPVDSARATLNDVYAPDFRWHRSDGSLDSLRGHLGQVVLLNFWATWCGPCKAEMPAIQSVADQLGDSVFVIGVAIDQCNPFSTVSDYIQSNGIHYQIAVDSLSRLYEQYWLWNPLEIPQSYFIRPDGRIKTYSVGAGDEAAILTAVRNAEN